MPNQTPSTEMPKYVCHKTVHALKILEVNQAAGILTPANAAYAPIRVDAQYMGKHRPQAGGYYVVYADGYESFSPADAFEAGYTAVSG